VPGPPPQTSPGTGAVRAAKKLLALVARSREVSVAVVRLVAPVAVMPPPMRAVLLCWPCPTGQLKLFA
jgi:hypothetical protein